MRGITALLFSLLACTAAQAQTYPSRPITIVAPFPPGASTDFIARLLREPLAEALGQSDRGREPSRRRRHHRHAPRSRTRRRTATRCWSRVNAPVTMNVYMQKNFPFDPKTAFAPIVTAADVVLVLAVNAALPVKSVPELIDYAKKNAGKKLSYGSAGIGSAHHIAGELLKQKTGIDMVHVPYRGGGPAIQDLVAGHIPISFGTTPAVLPQAAAGTIRISRWPRQSAAPTCRTFRPSTRPCPAWCTDRPGSGCSRRPARRSRSSIA